MFLCQVPKGPPPHLSLLHQKMSEARESWSTGQAGPARHVDRHEASSLRQCNLPVSLGLVSSGGSSVFFSRASGLSPFFLFSFFLFSGTQIFFGTSISFRFLITICVKKVIFRPVSGGRGGTPFDASFSLFLLFSCLFFSFSFSFSFYLIGVRVSLESAGAQQLAPPGTTCSQRL